MSSVKFIASPLDLWS
uniref:Uncharacterized protein n=1 Tax=Arundo donax TaxID=35708 RepID=A0A0A8YH67_ARUDO